MTYASQEECRYGNAKVEITFANLAFVIIVAVVFLTL